MSATLTTPRRWESRAYTRILSVRFDAAQLLVAFADGSEVRIAVDRFDNPTIRDQEPDWAAVRVGEHEVVVPTAAGEVGIPWDSVRALTDAEFAAHWAEMAAEVARGIGARVRALREERRLDPAELAQRAGVLITTVAQVEAGQSPTDWAVLGRILTAMGCTSADLVEAPKPGTA